MEGNGSSEGGDFLERKEADFEDAESEGNKAEDHKTGNESQENLPYAVVHSVLLDMRPEHCSRPSPRKNEIHCEVFRVLDSISNRDLLHHFKHYLFFLTFCLGISKLIDLATLAHASATLFIAALSSSSSAHYLLFILLDPFLFSFF